MRYPKSTQRAGGEQPAAARAAADDPLSGISLPAADKLTSLPVLKSVQLGDWASNDMAIEIGGKYPQFARVNPHSAVSIRLPFDDFFERASDGTKLSLMGSLIEVIVREELLAPQLTLSAKRSLRYQELVPEINRYEPRQMSFDAVWAEGGLMVVFEIALTTNVPGRLGEKRRQTRHWQAVGRLAGLTPHPCVLLVGVGQEGVTSTPEGLINADLKIDAVKLRDAVKAAPPVMALPFEKVWNLACERGWALDPRHRSEILRIGEDHRQKRESRRRWRHPTTPETPTP